MKYKSNFISLFLLAIFFSCNSQTVDNNRPLKAPKGYWNETFLKISYGLGILDLINTTPEIPDDILEIKNVEYKKIDTLSLQLDLYKPKNLSAPTPVLIFIHGGAWKKGKRADYLPYLVDYAKKGYITATISYRLTNVAPFPAALLDVNCAIKWIKNHADEFGIDANKIALVGGSAGGHLALMAGFDADDPSFSNECGNDTVSTKVNAIIDLYGPVDLTTPYAQGAPSVKDFLHATYEVNPDIYKAASPKTYITADDPPTLIFQGTIDSLVPVSQSDSLDQWLSKAGVPHEYHRLKGWPHTMDLSVEVNEYCQFYMDAFLKKYLDGSQH